MTMIRTKDIEVSFDGKAILKKVSLNFEQNKLIGIIGPNGSGKTTLLKCIYRVLKADSGQVVVNEKELWDMSPKESAKAMSVVAQHNYYNFDFTVEEIVLMGRAPHKKPLEADTKDDYEIVHDALKKVGMYDFRYRIFSSLSGGEQQRVILARALAQQTKCLILDEPTNHLDIKYQLELMKLVKSLDITVIAAIHDLNIASMYCDEIIVMKDGQVQDQGTAHQVLTPEFVEKIYGVNSKKINLEDGTTRIIFI